MGQVGSQALPFAVSRIADKLESARNAVRPLEKTFGDEALVNRCNGSLLSLAAGARLQGVLVDEQPSEDRRDQRGVEERLDAARALSLPLIEAVGPLVELEAHLDLPTNPVD